MKRLLMIFDLSKNEQRVVLIVVFVLVAISFVGYECRILVAPVQPTAALQLKPSPTPGENEDE
jgi:hypothetical protein